VIFRSSFCVPSMKKRISARTSVKRYVRNNLGLKAPRGWGWLTNPKKAAYNRIYNRTTRGCLVLVVAMVAQGLAERAYYVLYLACRAMDADDIEMLEELEDQTREMADMVEARWQAEGL